MINLADMQVVVLMGGLGTRLKDFTKTCPKSLVEVNNKPFFEYQLDLLRAWGFKKFLFLIAYKANMIEDYFGDGSDKGISIDYCYDGEELLGTGGAVRRAYSKLEDDFMLIYGDSFMDIDYAETLYRYSRGKENGARALMTVLCNNNRFDKSNVVMDNGKLVLYDKHNPTPDMDYIDYGVCVYEKSLFDAYEEGEKFDIAKIQHELSLTGEMVPQIVTKRFYEIGNPDSLAEFTAYSNRRFNEIHPAVFLDRDGVINEIAWNEDIEQLDSPLSIEQVKFLPGVIEGMREMANKGYYIFIVTNQPAAAKGKTSLAKLYDINSYIINELSKEGIFVDDLFMCPHYPKEGPLTKEKFLIKKCDCRKPKPGLLHKAIRKYNIDLANSFMVGDSCTDVEAGNAVGVKTVFLGNFKCDACKVLGEVSPTYIAKDLQDVAQVL